MRKQNISYLLYCQLWVLKYGTMYLWICILAIHIPKIGLGSQIRTCRLNCSNSQQGWKLIVWDSSPAAQIIHLAGFMSSPPWLFTFPTARVTGCQIKWSADTACSLGSNLFSLFSTNVLTHPFPGGIRYQNQRAPVVDVDQTFIGPRRNSRHCRHSWAKYSPDTAAGVVLSFDDACNHSGWVKIRGLIRK